MTWAALKPAGGPASRGAKVVGGSFLAARVVGGVTFGVGEFLLLDPATGRAVLAAPELLRMLDGKPGVHHELMRFQVEVATPVYTSLEGAMSGFAARNACGDGEEGTADQAARSVRCRADGRSWLIVFLLALSVYFPVRRIRRRSLSCASPGNRCRPVGVGRHSCLACRYWPWPAITREPGGAWASEVAGLS